MTAKRDRMYWYNGWSPAERSKGTPLQRQAIATGLIATPTTCSICGVTPEAGSRNPVWLHDENYAEPLNAFHVCRSCHLTLHRRFEEPGPWRDLVARHATGGSWFANLTMDPDSRFRPFAETYPNGVADRSAKP